MPTSTNILYGGKGDPNKPEADKFYGSKGTDIFVYTLGDGKDQISDGKAGATTKFGANDIIVLGSANADELLTKDSVYITDNKNVVTVQLGTDTKKGTLTIIKEATDTPIKFVLTKDSDTALAVASSLAGDGLDSTKAGKDYTVYEYGLSNDTLVTDLTDKGVLNIAGTQNLTAEELEGAEYPLVGVVNTKDISSAIKNVGVGGTAGDTLSLYVVGNNNANSISLGAGGGTIDGSYSKDSKGKIKATADKYYGGSGADVFMYNTLADGDNDVGGKDIIYNYEPGKDAIRINSTDDIRDFKYSEKNIVFNFNGAKPSSKGNVLTIQGINGNANSLPSDTQISFIVGEDGKTSVQTFTFFDKKSTTKIEQLSEVKNPWTAYIEYNAASEKGTAWTPTLDAAELNVWHYTSNDWTNNGLNFTIMNVADHYANTVPTGHIDVDVNVTGIRPVGVSVEEPGGTVIDVTQVRSSEGKDASIVGMLNISDFLFNKDTKLGAEGVHIKGINLRYDTLGVYNDEDVASVSGKGDYRLANLDGDTTNGYELLKMNDSWQLNDRNMWIYDGDMQFTVNTGSDILDVRQWGDAGDNNSDYNNKYAGSPVNFYVNGEDMTVDAGIKSDQLKFALGTRVAADGIHINGFDTMTSFSIGNNLSTTVGGKTTMVAVYNDYVLADLDGSLNNGYELLKKNDHWTLTPEEWKYENGSTKFDVKLIAPTLAANEDGAAEGIEVRYHPGINNNGLFVDTLENKNTGMVIDFNEQLELENFANSLLAFDGGIATGKNGVHIKGLIGMTEDPQVTVGGEAYWLVNLDDDMVSDSDYRKYNEGAEDDPYYYTNGLELAKVNDKWTPVYNDYYDDGSHQDWEYKDDNVQFTLTSRARFRVGSTDDGPIYLYGEDSSKAFAINDDGSVKYVTVGDDGVINIGRELTSSTTTKIGSTNVTLDAYLGVELEEAEDDEDGNVIAGTGNYYIQGIELAATTKTGASGIHIKGYNADTRITMNDTNYQLVDLDGSSDNGYELMKVDDNWTFKGGVWSYDNDDVAFTFDKNSGLKATDFGQASGVSVNNSTIVFSLDDEAQQKALNSLTFTSFIYDEDGGEDNITGLTAGTKGLHIKGLAEDTKISLRTVDYTENEKGDTVVSEYQVAALDNDTTNGSEVMLVDDQWKFKDNAWTFSNASTTALSSLVFSISDKASIRPNADGTGKPGTITYSEPAEGEENSAYTLNFSNASNFIATNLTISKLIRGTGNNGETLYGANGLHIVLPNAHSAAGTLYSDTKLVVGNDTYQLVDLDEDDSDYELMKVDSNWSLNGGSWTYYNSNAGGVAVSISAANGAFKGLNGFDDGKPIGATVTANSNGATLSLPNDEGENGIRFSNLNNVKIQQATYGTSSNAFHVVGEGLTEGEELTIGTATQKYRLANLDNNGNNGYELMKKDDKWTVNLTSGDNYKSWSYDGTIKKGNLTTALKFKVDAGLLNPTDDGTPTLASVDTVSGIITVPISAIGDDGSKIHLTEAETGIGAGAVHFKFTGNGNPEGKKIDLTIGGTKTEYALFDADGNPDNGYELTNDGWLQATINGSAKSSPKVPQAAFHYNSSKAEYYLTGSAFGSTVSGPKYDTDKPAGVSVEDGKLKFEGKEFDTTAKNFHIKTDDATTVNVNGKDFTLRNADGNANNGLELTNDGWAMDIETENKYTFYNLDGNFTITAGVAESDDNNNTPKGITYSGGTLTFNGEYDSVEELEAITIKAASSWSAGVSVENNELSENNTIVLKRDTTDKTKFTISVTSKSESSQLPADGYSTSGYDVDDLINYDGSSAATDELDAIMDVKPLAAQDEFSVSSLLDGIGGLQKTLNDLTYSNRHRQKK